MGRVIVTTGRYSENPYTLRNSKLKICSIEELCYHIIKNPELCEDFLYDPGLAVFFKEKLEIRDKGSILADLIAREAPIKDIMNLCLSSCDYCTREEIEEFLSEQSRVEKSDEWIKIKNKADSYLQHENYRDAVSFYRQLLREKDTSGITPETLGDIYHNLGVALLNTEGFVVAIDYFREAYERNNREESLKQYLLALRYSDDSSSYLSALDIYQVSEETERWLNEAFYQSELESQIVPEVEELENAKKYLKTGKLNEFYHEVKLLTEQMKEQYRKNNE
ncbi:MAG: tetratricopeptide repeat protein [Lachnospiraceae bacterium]|nr:tetratricopeptide repeat protein [Lachnospiraceae bacterium]